MACWSGWMESPEGRFAEMFVQRHVPFVWRTPRWALMPPTYRASGLFGATAANQSYQACPVCRSAGGGTAVNEPPKAERRHRYGLGMTSVGKVGSGTLGEPAPTT